VIIGEIRGSTCQRVVNADLALNIQLRKTNCVLCNFPTTETKRVRVALLLDTHIEIAHVVCKFHTASELVCALNEILTKVCHLAPRVCVSQMPPVIAPQEHDGVVLVSVCRHGVKHTANLRIEKRNTRKVPAPHLRDGEKTCSFVCRRSRRVVCTSLQVQQQPRVCSD
jgi:hypothetical protein